MRRFIARPGITLATVIIPFFHGHAVNASPQSIGDVVVMRRTIADPRPSAPPTPVTTPTPIPSATPTPGDLPTYDWQVGEWSDAEACARVSVGTRQVSCANQDGTRVDDAQCSGQRPVSSRSGQVVTGCPIDWAVGEFSDSRPVCSAQAYRTRTVSCQASFGDGGTVKLDEDACGATRPPEKEGPIEDFTNCGTWSTAWRPLAECSAGEVTEELVAKCSTLHCNPATRPEDGMQRTATCTSSCGALVPSDRVAGYTVGAFVLTTGAKLQTGTHEEKLKLARSFCEAAEPSDPRYTYRVRCEYYNSTPRVYFSRYANGAKAFTLAKADNYYASTCQ